ncbi:MAG TPA: hypothetical protein VEV63_09330, partial [Streptosporangiaceae bacterium]|nr:hypothetical protein [Streptosporangiaceae bacterium]
MAGGTPAEQILVSTGIRTPLWLSRSTLLRHVLVALVGAVAILGLSVVLSSFRDFELAFVAAYVVGVAGLTVLIGLSGQISIGNGA